MSNGVPKKQTPVDMVVSFFNKENDYEIIGTRNIYPTPSFQSALGAVQKTQKAQVVSITSTDSAGKEATMHLAIYSSEDDRGKYVSVSKVEVQGDKFNFTRGPLSGARFLISEDWSKKFRNAISGFCQDASIPLRLAEETPEKKAPRKVPG